MIEAARAGQTEIVRLLLERVNKEQRGLSKPPSPPNPSVFEQKRIKITMAIAIPPASSSSSNSPFQPERRSWTVAEFERFIDLGVFGPDERLELVNGEIVKKVTQNPPHSAALRKTEKLLNRLFAERYDVRPQMPLNFGPGTGNRPEPDLAVVVGAPEDYTTSHPMSAVLVVEISDATLAYDRGTKAAVYARAGIGELWIVNLVDRLLEVHRQPRPMAEQPLGHGFLSITRHTEGETVAPLAAPETPITVAALLP